MSSCLPTSDLLKFIIAQKEDGCKYEKTPAYRESKRELRLDINVDGQILRLGWAKILTVDPAILLCSLETDGKPEI